MKTFACVAVVCSALTLAGCQTTQGGSSFANKCQVGGTIIGAGLGLLIGSQLGRGGGNVAAMIAGTAAGAFLGNQVGGMLDCEDQKAAAVATQQAADGASGDKIYWSSQTATRKVDDAQKQQTANAAPAARPAATAAGTAAAATASKPKPVAKSQAAPPAAALPTAALPAAAAPQPTAETSWQVKEPVVSEGQSGMWGWSEPAGPATTAADGRTCRQIRQVVVDQQNKQTEQVVNSCRDADNRWVVVSR